MAAAVQNVERWIAVREAAISRLLGVNLADKRAPAHGWWDLTPAPACLSNGFMALLMLLRRSAVEIVEAVGSWRAVLSRRAARASGGAYMWRGENYLLRVATGQGGEPETASERDLGELEGWLGLRLQVCNTANLKVKI